MGSRTGHHRRLPPLALTPSPEVVNHHHRAALLRNVAGKEKPPSSLLPLLVGERKVAVAVYSLPLIEEEKQSVVEGLPPATPSPNVAAALPEQRSEPVALPLEREDGRERMLKLPVSAAKTCRCYTHRHRLLAPPEAEESREREKIATPPHGTVRTAILFRQAACRASTSATATNHLVQSFLNTPLRFHNSQL
nr:hypothetical protein Iba_chr05cCG10740 [Ipomoea batatas]